MGDGWDTPRDPPLTIDYFRSMSEQAFLDRFKRFLRIDSSTTDWINVGTIESALENDRARETVPFREEAQQLAELLASADSFRRKIVEVLSWFDERLFEDDRRNSYYPVGNPDGDPYGFLWRIIPEEAGMGRGFYHTGLGVHLLAVLPERRMVLVHRVDTDIDFDVTWREIRTLMEMIVKALDLSEPRQYW